MSAPRANTTRWSSAACGKRESCQAWQEHLAAQAGSIATATPEEQAKAVFKSHTELVKELVHWVVDQQIPGDFTCDSYFTNAPVLNFINPTGRGYVGDAEVQSQGVV